MSAAALRTRAREGAIFVVWWCLEGFWELFLSSLHINFVVVQKFAIRDIDMSSVRAHYLVLTPKSTQSHDPLIHLSEPCSGTFRQQLDSVCSTRWTQNREKRFLDPRLFLISVDQSP